MGDRLLLCHHNMLQSWDCVAEVDCNKLMKIQKDVQCQSVFNTCSHPLVGLYDLIVWINNVYQYFQHYGVPGGSATIVTFLFVSKMMYHQIFGLYMYDKLVNSLCGDSLHPV